MANNIKIPPIPTKDVRFDKGILKFEIMKGCAYCPSVSGFVGGEWTKTYFRTEEGAPALIRLDGGKLIIEKLVNYAVEKSTGHLVGGEFVEIVSLDVCE